MADETEGGAEAPKEPQARVSAEEPLGEMFASLLGKLWRRSRVEMERAAKRGKERLTLRQLRSDRDRMYQKLGKEARNLLEGGEIAHPGLARGVERIRELEAKLLEAEDALRARGEEPDAEKPEADAANE